MARSIDASTSTYSLSNTKVTDLSPLSGLSSLNELALDGTKVSDLSPLANLSKLEKLDLRGIDTIGQDEVATLQKSLPQCRIGWTVHHSEVKTDPPPEDGPQQ